MSETKETKIARKGFVIALGIVCIILVACLGGVIAEYTLIINDKNNTISLLNSQTSQMNSNVTNLQNRVTSDNSTVESLLSQNANLQNQLNTLSNLTGANLVSISQINLDPSKWENKTIVVMGKLSGPYFYFTAISYGYVLSSNGTVASQTELDPNSIGVDFGNKGNIYDSVNAVVVGVVKKGIIGTIVAGAQPTIIYFIEEEAVLPF